jgi:hypothetical protein
LSATEIGRGLRAGDAGAAAEAAQLMEVVAHALSVSLPA